MSNGLVQRRRGNPTAFNDAPDDFDDESSQRRSSNDSRKYSINDQNKTDDTDDNEKGSKLNKLSLLDEVFLLGLKDAQGYLSFWNDNISYVLRGCILMELSLRNRIVTQKEVRKRPFSDRYLEVIDEKNTGEVILDEALKLVKVDRQSISSWIDLLSGETWNLMKVGYQLKQVRERIAKGLVDKGVLRTEKRNFVLFDMATHPVANQVIKDQLIQRVVDTLLGRGPSPDPRSIALVCAAYAANVLENALTGLTSAQREQCFAKVDEFLLEHSVLGDKAKACGTTDIMAGVLVVYTKMDSIL